MKITAEAVDLSGVPRGIYLEDNGVICMEADGYARQQAAKGAAWTVLKPYGRTRCGIKVMPPALDFRGPMEKRPWVEYSFMAFQEGDYDLDIYMAPSNTATSEHRLCFGVQINGGRIREINGVGEDFRSLDLLCEEWDGCVRNNTRIRKTQVSCVRGMNNLRIFGGSPLVVLERLVLYPSGTKPQDSFLGPPESFAVR